MMNKNTLFIDERNINIILRICTALYLITLILLIGVQLYRQFGLQQALEGYQDIANIITFNVFALIGLVLYLGGFTPQKVKIRHIIALYIGFVTLGLIFTTFKYAVLLGQEVSLADFREYFKIVSVICGLLVIIWSVLAYLGKKRIDKQIE